jgi:CheY-like chemotaxis protein/predicted regulator of Ras-like GTPase activity (Roadblock/LC7/MglB family)
VRVLWSEEYDIVICDLKTPGAEGIEFLQWLRAYRPSTDIILVGEAAGEANDMRMQALEGGAASYLEKPLDIHILKEELRRLLQQTGFSANLDSFDLLDVIQIITMSHKSIALLINTGLEERGILRFKNGELIWAEYGILRGEEAFFALAAHKNGTVIDQPWNDHIASNVTQPLSRLIFQALQYRTKYANKQQFTGEQEVVSSPTIFSEEIDDRPFAFFEDLEGTMQSSEAQEWVMPVPVNESFNDNTTYQSQEHTKEWWEKTGSIPEIKRLSPAVTHQLNEDEVILPGATKSNRAAENGVMQPIASYQSPVDLPSWLTDQPTASNMPVIPSAIISTKFPNVPITPLSPSSSPGWQYPENGVRSEPLIIREAIDGQQNGANARSVYRSSPAWQMPEVEQNVLTSDGAQALTAPGRPESRTSDTLSYNESQLSQPLQIINPPRLIKRSYNYASLVAALQTLGYAIAGFEAAAVVTMEGKPIAQVSIDDQDLSQHCKHLCATLKSALQLQEGQEEDALESLVLERNRRRTLLRVVGSERDTFLALMTRRDADLAVSRDIIDTIENAINVALRG